MSAFVVIGGAFAAGLLVAPPRLVFAAACAVALVYLMATYRTPAEDGDSHRSEKRPSSSQ